MNKKMLFVGRRNSAVKFFLSVLFIFLLKSNILSLTTINNPLTIKVAMRIALQNNKEILKLKKEVKQAKIKKKIVGGIFRESPEISTAFDDKFSINKKNSAGLDVSINLPLETRNQWKLKLEKANIEISIKKMQLKKKKNEIGTKLRYAFLNINILKKKIKILNDKLKIDKELKEFLKTKANFGETSQLEVNMAELDIFNTQEKLLTYKAELTSNIKEIEAITNTKIPKGTEIIFNISKLPELPEINKLINFAKTTNPDIGILNLQKKLNSIQTELINKSNSLFSHITPFLSYSYDGNENNISIGLSTPLPFFNHKKEKIILSKSKRELMDLQNRQTINELEIQIKKDYEIIDIYKNKNKIYSKEILPHISNNMDNIKLLYEKGEIDFTTLEHYYDNFTDLKIKYYDFIKNYYYIVFKIENLICARIKDVSNNFGGKK